MGVGGDEGSVEAGGRLVDVHVQVGQAALEELPGGGDRVATTVGGVEGHEPAVGLLGVAVHVDDPLQDGDGGVGVAGVVLEFGEAEVGVDGAAVEVLADRFHPPLRAAGQQVALVGVDRLGAARRGPVGRRRRGPRRRARTGSPTGRR